MGSVVAVSGPWSTGAIVVLVGSVAPQHVGSSWAGMESMSPALADEFFTTEPLGTAKMFFLGRNIDKSELSWWLNGKETACNAGHMGSIPGLEDPTCHEQLSPCTTTTEPTHPEPTLHKRSRCDETPEPHDYRVAPVAATREKPARQRGPSRATNK